MTVWTSLNVTAGAGIFNHFHYVPPDLKSDFKHMFNTSTTLSWVWNLDLLSLSETAFRSCSFILTLETRTVPQMPFGLLLRIRLNNRTLFSQLTNLFISCLLYLCYMRHYAFMEQSVSQEPTGWRSTAYLTQEPQSPLVLGMPLDDMKKCVKQ